MYQILIASFFQDTFLHINDQINTVLDRYEAFKRGDYAAAANPIPKELAGSSAQGGGLSLIDFDDSTTSNGGVASNGGGNTIDELASLFGPGSSAPVAHQQPIPIQQQIQHIQQQQQPQLPVYTAPQHTNPNANLFAQLGMGGAGTSTSSVFSPQPMASATMGGTMSGGLGPAYGMQPQNQTRPPFAVGTSTPSQSFMSHQGAGASAMRTGSPMMNAGVGGSMGTPPPGHGALRLGSPSPYLTNTNTGGSTASAGTAGNNGRPASMFGGNVGFGVGLQPQQVQAQPQAFQTQPMQQPQTQSQAQTKDPFADLAGLF